MPEQVSAASTEIVNAATNCILPSSSGGTALSTSATVTDVLNTANAATSLTTDGLTECLTGAVNDQLSGLTATVTRFVNDAFSSSLGVSGGNAGINVASIQAQLQPLLQQTLTTVIAQVPGLQNLIEITGLPQSPAELFSAAEDVAFVLWGLLPLPTPINVTLVNGLDQPGTTRSEHISPAAPSSRQNGANLTAPLTGYALSVSSENTNVLSGMSSCTLEGYARVEPSPRGMQYFLYAGLLSPPQPVVPTFVDDADEAASYFSSALWQPFPFNNFNFLLDNTAFTGSIDSNDISQCKRTYLTRGSSPPLFWDAGGRLPQAWELEETCPGRFMTCTLNVPDDSTAWLDSDGHVGDLKRQQPGDKCINEFATLYGPDPLPSVGVFSYGGMVSIADRAPSGRSRCADLWRPSWPPRALPCSLLTQRCGVETRHCSHGSLYPVPCILPPAHPEVRGSRPAPLQTSSACTASRSRG